MDVSEKCQSPIFSGDTRIHLSSETWFRKTNKNMIKLFKMRNRLLKKAILSKIDNNKCVLNMAVIRRNKKCIQVGCKLCLIQMQPRSFKGKTKWGLFPQLNKPRAWGNCRTQSRKYVGCNEQLHQLQCIQTRVTAATHKSSVWNTKRFIIKHNNLRVWFLVRKVWLLTQVLLIIMQW